ncbi:MAG: hypothetical protein EOO46_21730 [Flavobacterium sp.]|nr:MAG: hypothetical protein EOO46_21730 [Flavobacterium sp.]
MRKVIIALSLISSASAFGGGVSGGGGLNPARPVFEIQITEDQLESTLIEAMKAKSKIKPIELELGGELIKLNPKSFDFRSRTISVTNSKGEIGELRQIIDEQAAPFVDGN